MPFQGSAKRCITWRIVHHFHRCKPSKARATPAAYRKARAANIDSARSERPSFPGRVRPCMGLRPIPRVGCVRPGPSLPRAARADACLQRVKGAAPTPPHSPEPRARSALLRKPNSNPEKQHPQPQRLPANPWHRAPRHRVRERPQARHERTRHPRQENLLIRHRPFSRSSRSEPSCRPTHSQLPNWRSSSRSQPPYCDKMAALARSWSDWRHALPASNG